MELTSEKRLLTYVKLQITIFMVPEKLEAFFILKANHCKLPVPLESDRMNT